MYTLVYADSVNVAKCVVVNAVSLLQVSWYMMGKLVAIIVKPGFIVPISRLLASSV